MNMRVTSYASILGCLLAAGQAHGAALLRDGGFETPATPAGGYTLYGVGQSVGPWTVIGPAGSNLNTVSTSYVDQGLRFVAKAGSAYMDLTGTTNAATGVSQTVSTTPGTSYRLTFWVGNVYDPSGPYGTKTSVTVKAGSSTLIAKNNVNGGANQVWKRFSLTFTATTTTTTVQFINADPSNDSDCGLDAVSLAPVAADRD